MIGGAGSWGNLFVSLGLIFEGRHDAFRHYTISIHLNDEDVKKREYCVYGHGNKKRDIITWML